MRESFQEFEAYLKSHRGLKPTMHFGAYGLRAAKPPKHGWGYLPSGDVVFYPEWLAFLSLHEEDTRAWYERLISDAVDETKSLLKLKKWVANPATFLIDVAVRANELRKEEQAFWQKAKTNKHSLFLPLKKIRSVETGSLMLQGQFVKIGSTDQTIIICENLDYENLFQQLRNTFGGKWQPDFVKALRDAVARNS